MSSKITMTVKELESLLKDQKEKTAEYITRNLSTYSCFREAPLHNNQKMRDEMIAECIKSPFPNDFFILKKYLPYEQ